MAISSEAFSIGHGATYPVPDHTDDGKVARLEHFLGRRGPDHRHRPDTKPFDPHRLHEEFDELTIRFEPDQSALWCLVNHTERPCFTPRFLDQIRTLQTRLRQGLAAAAMSADMPVRTVVWGSRFPGIWNLGGDLELFTRLIRAHAAEELRSYAYACVDAVYQNLTKMGLPLLTIGLVQGDALGGGFETRADQRRDHRRARQQAGPAGGSVQYVPGHGRLQPAVSPPRWRACAANDPERPAVRGSRARGARTGGPGGRHRAMAPPRCASTSSAIDGATAPCWRSVGSASAASRSATRS